MKVNLHPKFVLKVSSLLLILFLGSLANVNSNTNKIQTAFSNINKVSVLKKTNSIRQFMDNNWFAHQAR